MFHILGFLFIIIIAILLIGLSIIGTVIRNIFGLGAPYFHQLRFLPKRERQLPAGRVFLQ